MKVIILAGGMGTRLSEETQDKPKPLVKIGEHPILWHIMKIYRHYGHNEFIIAAGYKSEMITDYCESLARIDHNVSIKVLDTGLNTATGGRIKKCLENISDEIVFATYGDGVANINLHELFDFHLKNGGEATLTAVRPPARFGRVQLTGSLVTRFGEKNQSDEGWINGGFFVLNRSVLNWISDYQMPFEHDPLVNLSKQKELFAYKHEGFWQPMDTLREKLDLEGLWKENCAPWKIWSS